MTCENCYHNDACNAWIKRGEILYSDYIYSTKYCPFFKDKSRIVELPCKVGDKVYQADSERVYESTVTKIIYDTNSIAFDERAIGETVFLTREEAEEALRKERDFSRFSIDAAAKQPLCASDIPDLLAIFKEERGNGKI